MVPRNAPVEPLPSVRQPVSDIEVNANTIRFGRPGHRPRFDPSVQTVRIIIVGLLVLVFIPCPTVLAQSWEELPNAPSSTRKHDDIFFLNTDVGWGISPKAIYHTDDGGQTWSRQFSAPGSSYLRAIGFGSDQVGWVGDVNNPFVYLTTNGGHTWLVKQLPEGPEGVCGLFAFDEKTVYGVGVFRGPAYFIKTNDGGDSWTAVDLSDHIGVAVDLHFWNKDEGVVIGGSYDDEGLESSRTVVIATTDGGRTWETRYEGDRTGERGWKLSFPTPEIGYVSIQTDLGANVPDVEYFLKTEDGGLTWEAKPFWVRNGSFSYASQGIGFVTPDVGWIGSLRYFWPTLATTDGGETWTEDGFGSLINRIRFLDQSVGYASGTTFYRYSVADKIGDSDP